MNTQALSFGRKVGSSQRAIAKEYPFDTPDGTKTLADLFDGRSRLMVCHFAVPEDWREDCELCASIGDGIEDLALQAAEEDVTVVAVSRTPLPEIRTIQARLGWDFAWASSFRGEFNYDFFVRLTMERFCGADGGGCAVSVFCMNEEGEVFHAGASGVRVGRAECVGAVCAA